MLRVSFLLIAVPLILGVIWIVKKALQHSNLRAKIDEVKETQEEYELLTPLDLEQIKKQREEVSRIKKEL